MYQAFFRRPAVSLFTPLALLLVLSISWTLPVPAHAAAFYHILEQTPDQRADALVAQMSLAEKISLLHGTSGSYVGNVAANTRLGIPALGLEDGPAGVADGMEQVTAFPATVNFAASWDTTLINRYGKYIADEESGKGANVVLGPTVNILRIPQWGRSFETLGEDPYLTSQLAVADIQGMQSQHVIATVKHFDANNQEYDRGTVNANVDERTLHEIYLPAFQAAVQQGHVGAVMCAYNRLNDIYSCEQPYLLNDVLKSQWNYPGFVMSDWGATHSTLQAVAAGLDMQMPDNAYYDSALQQAVQHGQVSVEAIDQMAHRILRSMYAHGLFDHPVSGSPKANVATPEHNQFSLQASEQGTVLLKNDQNILPLDVSTLKSIAVIGADASTAPHYTGGGSAHVQVPSSAVTPLQGIITSAGQHVHVSYTADVAQAATVARAADVAIVFANDVEYEGVDRDSLHLPDNQDQLISDVAQANAHTIVVLNTGASVLMPWLQQVQGVIEAWYPGQEDGDAIASILFGQTDPSGKLPMTFPARADDVAAHTPAQYPGINDKAVYSEGLNVGYRYYDARHIPPLFPFGYGLSYTSFAFSDLALSSSAGPFDRAVMATVTVKNTGTRSGADVVQLYVDFPAQMQEPPHQLKGFQKVSLAPGEAKTLSFMLGRDAFSYWDTTAHNFVVPAGTFQVLVGDSSRHLPLQASYQITLPTYNSLAQAYNNVGTSDDAGPASGNFDSSDVSYSTRALRSIGLYPGSVVTHNGISFTWPDVAAGGANNVVTNGQTIMLTGAGNTLGLLGAAASGMQSGTGTITYTDGSIQPFTLSFGDWSAHAPVPGHDLIATTPGEGDYVGSGRAQQSMNIYYSPIVLNSGKVLQSITLPINTNLHVFALGINSLQQAYNNVAVSDRDAPTSANFDGKGYSFPAQALSALGLMPGSVVSHNGIPFTWPDVASGQNDNVVASGQKLTLIGRGSLLAILGASVFGSQRGTATITYTDGSKQSFPLKFADWYAKVPVAGTEVAVTISNWDRPTGATLGEHAVNIYYAAVALQAGKMVASLTLPDNPKLHVFAMTVQ